MILPDFPPKGREPHKRGGLANPRTPKVQPPRTEARKNYKQWRQSQVERIVKGKK